MTARSRKPNAVFTSGTANTAAISVTVKVASGSVRSGRGMTTSAAGLIAIRPWRRSHENS